MKHHTIYKRNTWGILNCLKKCPLHLCGGDPLRFWGAIWVEARRRKLWSLTTGKTWLFLVSAGEGWSTKDGVLKPAHVWDSVYDTYHMNALRIENSGESAPRSWKESFTSAAPVSWSHHLGKQVMSCSLKAKIAAFYSFVVARTRWYNTKTPPGTVETWLRFPAGKLGKLF